MNNEVWHSMAHTHTCETTNWETHWKYLGWQWKTVETKPLLRRKRGRRLTDSKHRSCWNPFSGRHLEVGRATPAEDERETSANRPSAPSEPLQLFALWTSIMSEDGSQATLQNTPLPSKINCQRPPTTSSPSITTLNKTQSKSESDYPRR